MTAGNAATWLFITIFVIGSICVYFKYKWDSEYEIWFTELKRIAPYYGYTQVEIDNFDMCDWWDYFINEVSQQEAIKLQLSKTEK